MDDPKMAQQNDGLLDFFPSVTSLLSYHLVFVVVIMESKVASPPDKSTLSKSIGTKAKSSKAQGKSFIL